MFKQDDRPYKYATLSFDIEEWFQVESFKEVISIDDWENQEMRVQKGIDKILFLLERNKIKATFFILGWVAERNPNLVKRIYAAGHEIASHGYYHQLNYNMTNEALYQDIQKSKHVLESIINDKVLGYRAPTFSISEELIQILGELNFKYDSSFNQFSKHDRYGKFKNSKKKAVFKVSEKIIEVSLPVSKIFKQEVPIAGGGFFRLYPLWFTKSLIKKYYKYNNYYVFYAHPWEFDPNMPRLKNIGFVNKFRHYVNIESNYKKLEYLIKYLQSIDCMFLPINEYLNINKR